MIRLLFASLLIVFPAFPQLFSFGLKGGVPLTGAFKIAKSSAYFSDSRQYTIGPVVELHLPFRIGVEFDALYRPLKYGLVEAAAIPAVSTGGSWQFPLLLKHQFSGGLLRPYLGAGVAFQHLTGFTHVVAATSELRDRSNAGVVLEGGVELHVPFLQISPEIRYTRWGSPNFRSPRGELTSQVNQADFLIGITF